LRRSAEWSSRAERAAAARRAYPVTRAVATTAHAGLAPGIDDTVTEPLPLMPVGGVDGNGLYGRQTLRGNLAYGGGPHEWLALDGMSVPPSSSTPLMRNIAARLAALFPKARHARVIRSWAGLIENTPDGRPIIDRLATPENVVVATLSSVGFGLSPASGRAIRDLVLDGKCGFADIRTFALSRFAALAEDWEACQGRRPLAQSQ